jgi:hypothetical protein
MSTRWETARGVRGWKLESRECSPESERAANCGGSSEIGTARARAMVEVGVGFFGGSEEEAEGYL